MSAIDDRSDDTPGAPSGGTAGARAGSPGWRGENRGSMLPGPGADFRCESWPVEAAAGDVVLRVELCGLCGTDVHAAHAERPPEDFPVLLGHELVGRIASCPPELPDLFGRPLAEGDRVVLASASFGECQRCYACTVLHAPWQCTDRDGSLLRGGGPDVTVVGGGLARYVVLPPSRRRRLLSLAAPAVAGVLHEPLAVAVRTVRSGPGILGEDVVVQGTGAIGLLTILVARIAGAARIIAVGGPSGRLEHARRFGADVCIDIEEHRSTRERIQTVMGATFAGAGAAVVYEAAGVPAAVVEGMHYLRPSGVLMEAGNASGTGTTDFRPHPDLQAGGRRVIGVRGVRTEDFVIAQRLLEHHQDEIAALVTHRLPLERVTDGIRAMQGNYRLDGRDVVKIVIDPFGQDGSAVSVT